MPGSYGRFQSCFDKTQELCAFPLVLVPMDNMMNAGKWPLVYAINEETGTGLEPFNNYANAREVLALFDANHPLHIGTLFTLGEETYKVVDYNKVELMDYEVTVLLVSKILSDAMDKE